MAKNNSSLANPLAIHVVFTEQNNAFLVTYNLYMSHRYTCLPYTACYVCGTHCMYIHVRTSMVAFCMVFVGKERMNGVRGDRERGMRKKEEGGQ